MAASIRTETQAIVRGTQGLLILLEIVKIQLLNIDLIAKSNFMIFIAFKVKAIS